MHKFLAILILSLAACIALPAFATTYYVRTDGGPAPTCDGAANAPATAAPNCAFNHPFWVLVPGQGTSLMSSGDTLVIGSGSYMMGYGAPNAPAGNCNADGTPLCVINSIPSGIDAAHPTTITGDCSAPPELWATGGLQAIFNVVGKHDIKLACLNLTDHSNCIEGYAVAGQGVPACAKNPYGDWGRVGIRVAGSSGITFSDLDVHGFSSTGIWAAGFSGTNTFTRVKVIGNGRSGWDEDLGGGVNSNNTGMQTFVDLTIAWTGCAENYPPDGGFKGCFGPNQGGYGDAFSLADSGGDYVFIRPVIYKNTSDGLDLLHGDGTGFVTVDRGFFSKNVGNDVKIGGSGRVTNNVMINYCTWFADAGYPAGNGSCRAGGGELAALKGGPGAVQTWAYNTIISNGKGLFVGDSTWAKAGDVINLENNIFIGAASNGQLPFFDWYADGGSQPQTVNHVNNIVWNTRNTTCDRTGIICVDPKLTNETLQDFNPEIPADSPVAGKGVGPRPASPEVQP